VEAVINRETSVVLLVASVGIANTAHAQSQSAEPIDKDEEAEQYSSLWENAVTPQGSRYQQLIEESVVLMQNRDPASRAEAAKKLGEAIKAAPDDPTGHWWLGLLEKQRENWKACASSLAAVYNADPSFEPPLYPRTKSSSSPFPSSWALDYELGRCQAHAGEFEEAVAHFKRITSRGVTKRAHLHKALGEGYMALGRLDDAIESLESAHKLEPFSADTRFSLAVAFDRDEQMAKSRKHLEAALKREPRLAVLSNPQRVYSPPEDEFYYLGLANEARNERKWALLYFRRYLDAAGEGPWVRRARAHLEDLAEDKAGSDLVVRGSATVDRKVLLAAVEQADADYQKCIDGAPQMLLRVQITQVVGDKQKKKKRGRKGPTFISGFRPKARKGGVRVLPDHVDGEAHGVDVVRAAVRCSERVTNGIKLPKPEGNTGTFVTSEFRIIAR
jgi:tetratricopeptide (TPR) repeat protein